MQTSEDMSSPNRRTRQQEKEQLQHLNDRFVTYIDHVRKLREDKSNVDSAYQRLRTTTVEETDKVKRVYDRELEDARLLIDETAKDKARFQLLSSKNAEKVTQLENQLKELNDDYSRIQDELTDVKLNLEDSERQRRQLSSERVTSQHKIQELEDELEDLRGQIKKLQDTLEQETLAKVDLQNQIQSLKEDMAFRKKIYEEESMRRRTEVYSDSIRERVVEETDDDFSERLQAAIDEAREEIEKETERYRQDLEKAYRAKLNMLEKQTALDATTISKQSAEIRHLNSTLSQSNRTVKSLQDEKDHFELALRDKNEEIAIIKERHSDEVARVMEDMRTLRVNYEEKIKEYEDLLDLRVKLEQEIATLSALLQEEESRLNISSTPTRDKRKRTVDKDGPRTKKQKKQVDATSSSSAGSVQICDVDPAGRYVQLKNMSDKFESLGGFKIVHEVEGTGEKVEFKFHSKSKLQGGAAVTVWSSGADDAVHNPPTDLIWKSTQNWGHGGKTLTSLISKSGEVVATFTQRQEVSITETQQEIVLDETDSGSSSFPYIPSSSPERVRETQRVTVSSTPATGPHVLRSTRTPPPQVVRDEHIFHQQEDPNDQKNCVIS